MTHRFIRIPLLVLTALLVAAGLAGCKPKQEATAAAPVALHAPKDNDDTAWKNYLQQVIGNNREGVTDQIFPYYLPAGSDTDDGTGSSMYKRQLDNVTTVVQRTVLPGNMLVFASPESAKMADLVVAAFAGAQPDAIKGSKVLFVGAAADKDRVKAAVEPSGARFVFVEAN